MTIPALHNKKVAVVGMGTNNRKLADYLKKQGVNFEVIENWKNPNELIGKLDNFDVIFRTPGLPYLSKAVQQAKARGVEISSQTKLFFELCPAPIIGVTGTKGKGTTSSLIAKILEAAGKRVWLGGNIGKDPFGFLEQISTTDIVVLELSSFQLQDLEQSPHIAVVLDITSDHLNHHGSVEEYTDAKTSILKYQTEKDFAILYKSLPQTLQNLGAGKKIFFTSSEASEYATKLLGQHNRENIAAAVVCAKLLEIDEEAIKQAVAVFEALPHRLKMIRQVNAITYIDDAYSTNIGPAEAAIRAMNGPTILIVGGYDKGLDFSSLGKTIAESKNIKVLVVIGIVAQKILDASKGFTGKILTGAKNMPEILQQAQSMAQPGDTILFSPATSSFDMFKNETDRGDQFVKEVQSIK